MSDFLMSCFMQGRRPKHRRLFMRPIPAPISSRTFCVPVTSRVSSSLRLRQIDGCCGICAGRLLVQADVLGQLRKSVLPARPRRRYHRFARLKSGKGAGSRQGFDDLPRMDASRVEVFSEVVYELLAAGSEVLVTCTPTCDAYSDLHRDRVKLSARRFLLTDDEMKHTVRATDSPHAKCRAACGCVWPDESRPVAAGGRAQGVASKRSACGVSSCWRCEGSLSELVSARRVMRTRRLRDREDYPLLGVCA